MTTDAEHRYGDILHLPRHVSPTRTPMPRGTRAAQFMPFAALTGYDDAISETARLTQAYTEPDEESQSLLNTKLQSLMAAARQQPQVTILCFEPDKQKPGGAYLRITGHVRRVDDVKREITLTDQTVIPFHSIHDLQSDLFRGMEE